MRRALVVGSDGHEHAGDVLAQRDALPAAFSLQVPALVLLAVPLPLSALHAKSGAGAAP